MPVYKAEGIVIRRANLGEADRLVTLFCLDHGKVTVAARGARKMKRRFVGQVLVHSGYAPTTDACQVCGKPVRNGAAFSHALGGVLCEADRPRDPDAVMASAGALRAIGYLLHSQPEVLARLVLDPRQRAEVSGLLQRYLEYRLETKLKSLQVIRKITGMREQGNAGTRKINSGHLSH